MRSWVGRSVVKLLVERFDDDGYATLGRWYTDGEWKCYTLEDAYHAAKIPGHARIPAGEYRLALHTAGRWHELMKERYAFHRGMILLEDVPGFEWILVHPGNTADNTEGCILPGLGHDMYERHHRILRSRAAYELIYPPVAAAIEAGPTYLRIVDRDRMTIGD